MKDRELIKWLENNSSGAYRPSMEAAFRIEQLREALTEISEMFSDHFEDDAKEIAKIALGVAK